MSGGGIIRKARTCAGLTQRQLARRLGTSQPVVARWERGHRSPDYDTVRAAVRACGFDLSPELIEFDRQEEANLQQSLAMTPLERLQANQRMLDLEYLARSARIVRKVVER